MSEKSEKPKRKRKLSSITEPSSTVTSYQRSLLIIIVVFAAGLVILAIFLTTLLNTESNDRTPFQLTATHIEQQNATTLNQLNATASVEAVAQAAPSILPPPTDTPFPAQSASAPNCVWNTAVVPDDSALFLARMHDAGIENLTLVVEAPCGFGESTRPSSLAFHITLQVSDIIDEAGLGNELARVLTVLNSYKFERRSSVLNVSFATNSEQRFLWGVPVEQALDAYERELDNTTLIKALGGLQ